MAVVQLYKKNTKYSFKAICKNYFHRDINWGYAFFYEEFWDALGKYSLENVVATSSVTRGWIYYASSRDEEASAYSLVIFHRPLVVCFQNFPQL